MIKDPKRNEDNPLLDFFLGILLVATGIFLVFLNTDVRTIWYSWSIYGYGLPNAVIVIPLLIGIGLLFYNSRSLISWLVTILGLAFIIVTLILSVKIVFKATSLFNYLLMFGSIFAGSALLLKSLFKSNSSGGK